jgi:hypothetical protein
VRLLTKGGARDVPRERRKVEKSDIKGFTEPL